MPSKKTLSVQFGGITKDNVQQLRTINTSCFPVQYNDAFYKEVVDRKDEDLCKFAYWNGFVVGAICCRVEPAAGRTGAAAGAGAAGTGTASTAASGGEQQNDSGNTEKRERLYVMTLAVLAAYRGRGIGHALVKSVMDHVNENLDTPKYERVEEVTLHVQTSNEEAQRFYISGFGFEKGPMVENYYRRIDPPHCYVLSKKLR